MVDVYWVVFLHFCFRDCILFFPQPGFVFQLDVFVWCSLQKIHLEQCQQFQWQDSFGSGFSGFACFLSPWSFYGVNGFSPSVWVFLDPGAIDEEVSSQSVGSSLETLHHHINLCDKVVLDAFPQFSYASCGPHLGSFSVLWHGYFAADCGGPFKNAWKAHLRDGLWGNDAISQSNCRCTELFLSGWVDANDWKTWRKVFWDAWVGSRAFPWFPQV